MSLKKALLIAIWMSNTWIDIQTVVENEYLSKKLPLFVFG